METHVELLLARACRQAVQVHVHSTARRDEQAIFEPSMLRSACQLILVLAELGLGESDAAVIQVSWPSIDLMFLRAPASLVFCFGDATGPFSHRS